MFQFRPLLMSLSLLGASARLFSSSSSSEQDAANGSVPNGILHNGVVVPLVGLGCCSGVRETHVSSALSIGYRFLDTAQSYNWGYHEDEVGNAMEEFRNNNNNNNPSSDPIFVQTKIHPEDLGYEATKRAVYKSLERLKLKTIDSVLIHKPHCWEGACEKEPEGTWQDSWKALEEFYEAGIVSKSIGICDVHSVNMLEELLSQKIKPHIIQNWMDPLHQDTTMRQNIQNQGILYQAYSSLGTQWKYRGHSNNPVTSHPVLLEIAEIHGADVGQVVVNWATTRHKIAILPASTNATRQEGNLHRSFEFVLTEDELDTIDALDGKIPKAEASAPVDKDKVWIHFKSGEMDSPEKIDVYWIDQRNNNGEVHVGSVEAGRALSLNSHHGHTFRFKDPSGGTNAYRDHTIEKGKGNQQVYLIALDDDEEL